MKRRLIMRCVNLVFLYLILILTACPAYSANTLKPGGLVSYPSPVIGENLLRNSGFENIDQKTKLPAEWNASKAFSIDNSVSHSGNKSFRLKDAPLFQYSESSNQKVYLKKGTYLLRGWVKTENLGEKNKGIRFGVAGYNTPIIFGSNDWQFIELRKIAVLKDDYYNFGFHAYMEPSGTAWFDDIELRRESIPIEVFLLYPNYRGMLFDDQLQAIRVHISVDTGGDNNHSAYEVENIIVNESTGAVVSEEREKAAPDIIKTFDGSGLTTGQTYLLKTRLLKAKNNALVYEYPPYRISKTSGALRKKMTVAFDEHNRFMVRGTPTFFLGVYDSGMGYIESGERWVKTLKENRRLFELPINLYNNYWYGGASLKAMQALMDTLQKYDILYLQTGNCFADAFDERSFKIDSDDNFLRGISRHQGLAGFYTIDECKAGLAERMFVQYQKLKEAKPDGITFGALLDPNSLSYWRDAVDVLSTDPYPLWGAEPPNGYPLNRVADWTASTKIAVMDSRPFMTVLQFFLGSSNSRWPTRDELRNMSYMAITEGANGLLYWSLGVRALSYVCKDWCDKKIEHFEDLKSVMRELKGIEPALAAIDQPQMLAGNSNPSAIRTRIKYVNGKGYIIAYNYTNSVTKASFTWHSSPSRITVYHEGRTLQVNGSKFSDTFNPFQAHIYEIEGK
jgi:hypothetical protein